MVKKISSVPQWEMRIRNTISNFSSSEFKVAEYILKNPTKVIDTTIEKLAQNSNVSKTSVVRFCRTLGYSGLKEFKIAIAKEEVKDDVKCNPVNRKLDTADSTNAMIKKVFLGCMEALQDTMNVIDIKELERAIGIIYKAHYIDVFGMGGSASVARSALHSFRRIGLRMSITTEINNNYLKLQRFNRDDVVIAISLSGETKDIIDAVKIVKNKGVTVIGITNVRQSTLTDISDCCLVSASRTHMMAGDETYERVAQIAIIHTLYAGVAMRFEEGK